jgi:hypothetical protein
MHNIPIDDLFGIFFVKGSDGLKYDSYFKTINSLRSLFDDKRFKEVVDGFYISCIDGDTRISYFVDSRRAEKSIKLFQEFFVKNEIEEIKNHSFPHEDIIAQDYGGSFYEQRFRNFLNNYTQIGLELLQGNILHSRRLFTIYRYHVRQASISFESFFEPTFMKYSQFYASFSNEEKKQFFEDLKMRPQPTEWAHMMVNMIVGCDFYPPPYPLPFEKINGILAKINLGFQIPPTWSPKSFHL